MAMFGIELKSSVRAQWHTDCSDKLTVRIKGDRTG